MRGPNWYRGVVSGGNPIWSFRQFLAKMCRFATIQNVTDRRQTTWRAKGSTIRSAKNGPLNLCASKTMSENQPLFRKNFDALSLNHGTSRWEHSSTTFRSKAPPTSQCNWLVVVYSDYLKPNANHLLLNELLQQKIKQCIIHKIILVTE